MSRHLIAMVGPSPDGHGGMSSVVANYRAEGMFERCGVVYLSSHVEGSAWMKLRAALSAWFGLWSLLLRGHVRLVHIHTASGKSFWRKLPFATLTLLSGRPLLMHIHGGEFDRFHAKLGRLGRFVVRTILARSAAVIVLSRSWIDRLSPISPDARWTVVLNPVVVHAAARRDVSVGAPIDVLYLARLERAKGVFELLDAFAVAVRHVPSLRLVLAGDGDRPAVVERIKALGIVDRVELAGWVVGERKTQLLDRCAIFVLPSHIEGLPIAMLEAMAAYAPVIVSNVGSVPEVLTHGVDGWIVAPGEAAPLAEALVRLGSDSTLRGRLAVAARAEVERHYAAPRVVARLEALYEQAVGAVRDSKGGVVGFD